MRVAAILLGAVSGLAILHADTRYTRKDAELLRQKVATINAHAGAERAPAPPDDDYRKRGQFVSGLRRRPATADRRRRAIGDHHRNRRRLSGRAVSRSRRGAKGARDVQPLSIRPITSPAACRSRRSARFKTSEGMGWFQFEGATVGEHSCAENPAQEIVSYLFAHAGQAVGHRARRSVCTPGAHPRDPGSSEGQAIIVQ